MNDHLVVEDDLTPPSPPPSISTLPGGGNGPNMIPYPTERMPVDFTGDGAGVGELSWGQREIWTTMSRQRTWMPLGGRSPIAPGGTLADVADEVRYFMRRFQTMRTRLRFDGDRAYQEVFGHGEIGLDIFDADSAACGSEGMTAEELADEVEAHYRHVPLDFAVEWPARFAVVRTDKVPTYLISLVGHMAMDSFGARVMLGDVATRPTTPVAGMQPLEQARWQCSPAGQRVDELAQRYWERTIRAIPPRPYPSIPGRSPRFWIGEFRSSALHGAACAIASRTKSDTSSVLMALYAIGIARMSGADPVIVRPIVDNRFRPGLADVVCPATQGGICLLEVAGRTVDEAVEAARRAGLSAYKYAYFDPERLGALIDRITGEQDPDFGLGCYFNDRRLENRAAPTGPQATAQELRDARSSSTFRWKYMRDNPIEVLFLHVDDDPAGILLTIETDSNCFSPEDVQALVRGMEETAVAAL